MGDPADGLLSLLYLTDLISGFLQVAVRALSTLTGLKGPG